MKKIPAMLLIFAWLVGAPTSAQVEAVTFATAQQEKLYGALIRELRCLVCANQSLSDSNSELAKDLREKVRERVAAGQSRAQIVDFLVARYGEYVLYRPRFSAANYFLWLSPFAVVVGGLLVVRVIAGKSRRVPYSRAQLKKAKSLLNKK